MFGLVVSFVQRRETDRLREIKRERERESQRERQRSTSCFLITGLWIIVLEPAGVFGVF